MAGTDRVLYCHCAYARVVPDETRQTVLDALGAAGVAFDAVPDLCEMSARKDPGLAALASGCDGTTRIAACFPRAVRGLFHAAGAPLPDEGVEIANMREESAESVIARLLPGRDPMPGEERA